MNELDADLAALIGWAAVEAGSQEEYDAMTLWASETIRRLREEAWDEALAHAWQLNDPAYTIVETDAILPLLTAGDMEQARAENPYRAEA